MQLQKNISKFFSALLISSAFVVSSGLLFIVVSHSKMMSIQTGSMVPVYKRGDLVTVKRIPDSQLKVGDVITFINPRNNKQTITHRIVQLPSVTNSYKILTKGDANKTPDGGISPSSVVGKVYYSFPKLGFAVDFIRKPLGLLLVIYVPALMIVFAEIRRLADYYRKQQKYQAAEVKNRGSVIPEIKSNFEPIFKGLSLIVLLVILMVPHVKAALRSTATLKGTTISTAILGGRADHLVISMLTLRCSSDNSSTSNKRPIFEIYNPTKVKVDVSSWTLRDNSGVIVTLPKLKFLYPSQSIIFSPWLKDGFQYSGDHLQLYTKTGVQVDAISWGNDTSAFNPVLIPSTEGTRYRRTPRQNDADRATDFAVKSHNCRIHHKDGSVDPKDSDDDGVFEDCDEPDRTTVLGFYHETTIADHDD